MATTERDKKQKKHLGLKISAGIIVVILMGCTIYLQRTKGSLNQELKERAKVYSSLDKKIKEIKNTKDQRADFFIKLFLLDFPVKYAHSAADFLKALSLIVSSDIKLSEIEINPVNQNIVFLIRGKSCQGNNKNPFSNFLRFYNRLENLEGVIRISYNKYEEGKTDSSRGIPDSGNSYESGDLNFIINGEIELE